MCLRSDPLHKVMERLANPGIFFLPKVFVSQLLLCFRLMHTVAFTDDFTKFSYFTLFYW